VVLNQVVHIALAPALPLLATFPHAPAHAALLLRESGIRRPPHGLTGLSLSRAVYQDIVAFAVGNGNAASVRSPSYPLVPGLVQAN
jgi:hypothetical protein